MRNALDNMLIEKARPALEEGIPVTIESPVTNLNRTVGTMLSYEISKKYASKTLYNSFDYEAADIYPQIWCSGIAR